MNPILIVNDLPGSGQVAGMIAQSIITAAGFKTAWLPTVVLSHHTGNGPVIRHEIKDDFQQILAHWQQQAYSFSAYVTGYFATANQIDQFVDYVKKENSTVPLIVDPIMADHGKFYQGFNEQILPSMRHLVQQATIVLPNVTEACLMVGEVYPQQIDEVFIQQLLFKMKQMGAKQTLLTGVETIEHPGKISFYYLSSDEQLIGVHHAKSNRSYFGTGDLTSALLTSAWMHQLTLDNIVLKLSQWLSLAVSKTDVNQKEINYIPVMRTVMDFFSEEVESI
ncbi:bifunctional hydroxymethylpyrimidine kinase/phosphomethylpyrimidine kinase [Tuanshanicoccus lijuaniae]|uniref:bifunctional hydroxymethylpyrimidine kinase/phosphomethylpyrimidine kinase n=1 Tax=Aerococcaceae bacterium zg-1292 TaxID=2774330 RepID=UPI001938A3F7|nr:bifunctional hydroxymethylpyrimidine kinase/phosphomethylpyrimidine kinase [Aerococcaceae bacterium zg-1292]QQA36376.1 bifunctional hydroxymethylpyrimidine kinase/phosphomethylpyrimidine kinase [Aerococcaceae bacterium zg-1292]